MLFRTLQVRLSFDFLSLGYRDINTRTLRVIVASSQNTDKQGLRHSHALVSYTQK